MISIIVLGILLGWGAAIPIGPINLEIARRNLTYGTAYGLAFGSGACFADMFYLVLLGGGLLGLLKVPLVLKAIGIAGSLMLAWFGFKALTTTHAKALNRPGDKSVLHNLLQGCLLTLLNPITILFWASVGVQLPVVAQHGTMGIVLAGIGVLIGTFSWSLALNLILHITRHKISPRVMRGLNIVGGLIILAFAVYGLYHNLRIH